MRAIGALRSTGARLRRPLPCPDSTFDGPAGRVYDGRDDGRERPGKGAPQGNRGAATAAASARERPLRARRGGARAGPGGDGPGPISTSTSTSTSTPTRTAAPIPISPLSSLERRLETAIEGLEGRIEELSARAGLAALETEARLAVAKLLPLLRARLGTVTELVRLLEPPERLDRYGMDARFAERLAPVVDFFYGTWWRVRVRNVAAVPATGPAVVVANHAGLVPWDAFVLRHALRHEHPAHRDLRPLLDDEACAVPIFGPAAVRAGAVRAAPEAADQILAGGGVLGVFPEGSAGARKPWRDRYTIVRFGRGGFAKVALRASAPIVPCAIVGSEEASAGISRTGWLAERLGVPLLAANASLRIGSAALLPLPSRWTIRFGEPVDTADLGPAAASDPAAVNALAERVRSAVQAMLDEDVAARTSVFL
jgi:1-acyl-sn-glycerol-3-phosphate acyltransferase